MTGLAVWLLLIGVLDLIRSGRDASHVRLLLALTVVGALGSCLLAVLLRPTGSGWVAWLLAALGATGWILGSSVAAARFRGAALPVPASLTGVVSATVALSGLGLGLGALLLAGRATGSAPQLAATLSRSGLADFPPDRLVLLAAVLVLQISSANLLVRLLLDLVGVPASDNEKTLRGGRVLGPMERVLIVGLSVAGSLPGAAVVVAAKSLLRFPELRVPRAGDPGYGGPSDITEYFLVGSFGSWLVALGGVGLVALTA